MNSLMPAIVAALALSVLAGCGDDLQRFAGLLQGSGTSGKQRTADASPVDRQEIASLQGTVVPQSGTPAQLQGWNVVMTPDDRSASRVSTVNDQGRYSLLHASTTTPQTLTMLSPDYIIGAVTSMPRGPGALWQYFTPVADELPLLTMAGRVVAFQGTQGIVPADHLAADADQDGIPEGTIIFMQNDTAADNDLDGTPNARDPDVDGDGVANVFDPDDDGDAILDVFDADANGNFVNDGSEQLSDHHFDDGWVGVTYYFSPSGVELQITFRSYGTYPAEVRVRGAEALLGQASALNPAVGAALIESRWDRRLRDDGQSHDGNANDGVYAAKVRLPLGVSPRMLEVLFVELVDGERVRSLPHTFSTIRPQPYTILFDRETMVALLAGNPYGVVQDFAWAVEATCDGRVVWISPTISGVERQMTIPERVFERRSCQLRAQAYAMSQFAGYPWIINSSASLPVAD